MTFLKDLRDSGFAVGCERFLLRNIINSAMRTFQHHLEKKLKEKEFKKLYDEEHQMLEIALKILEARKNSGLSQKELARKAHITQQQLSKIENGVNCNMATFLKVCQALGMKLNLADVAQL